MGQYLLTVLNILHYNVYLWTARRKFVEKFVTAEVDREVTLPCRTTLETPVDWYYQKSENETAEFVSSGGEITDDFSTRFDLERSTFGDFSLIIHNVTKADEGIYRCREDAGQGMEHRITLNVGLTGKITQHAFHIISYHIISGISSAPITKRTHAIGALQKSTRC